MALKLFPVFLLVCLFGVYDVHGVVTLTASANSPCTSSSNNIPTGTGVTVTLSCSGTSTPTATIATAAGTNTAASIIFKQGGTAKFTLTGVANGDGTAIVSADTTNYPSADVSSLIPTGGANTLNVIIANANAATATGGTWTCEVNAGDDAGVTADVASTPALDLAAFCSGTLTTATFSVSHTAGSCTGTMTCTIAATTTTVQGAGGVVQFLKSGTVWFQVATDGTTVQQSDSSTAYAGVNAASSGTTVVATFSATTMLDETYDGSWTCQVVSSTTGTHNVASAAVTVAVSTTTACTAPRFSTDVCSKTLTCTLEDDVATVQTGTGVIEFKKGGTTVYKINPSDDQLQNNGGTAIASTVATVVAPSTSDSKAAVVTLATYDASAVDGYWSCDVSGSSGGTYDKTGAPVPVTYATTSCSGAGQVAVNLMFVFATLIAALMF